MARLSKLQKDVAVTVLYKNAKDFYARGLQQAQTADELNVLLKRDFPELFDGDEITKSIIADIWKPGGRVERSSWNKGSGTKKKARDTRNDADVLTQIVSHLINRLGGVQFPESLQDRFTTLEAEVATREIKRAEEAEKSANEPSEVVGEPVQAQPVHSEFGPPPAAAQ